MLVLVNIRMCEVDDEHGQHSAAYEKAYLSHERSQYSATSAQYEQGGLPGQVDKAERK